MSRQRLAGLAALPLLAALASCGKRDSAVRIAVAVPLTGDTGTEGQGLVRAVELAVGQANASGRFPFKIEARALDDRADPREAVNVANLIVSDPRIVAVVGHYNSGCAIPAGRVYAKAGVPMIVPAASNPKVTQQQLAADWPGPRNIFRVSPTDDVQGPFAGEYIRRALGLRTLAVIHDKTPYGQGLAEEVKAKFASLGGEVLSFDGVSVGEKDFRALLTRVAQSRPGGLYFGGLYTEGGLLLKQMRELGISIPFISGDAMKTGGLFSIAGAAADGAYLTMVGVPVEFLPSAKDFVRDYKARYPGAEIKPFDHFAYEAAEVALDALAAVGPDRAKLLERIRATDREGILGRTRFDEKGDTTNKVIAITRADWKARAFVPIQ